VASSFALARSAQRRPLLRLLAPAVAFRPPFCSSLAFDHDRERPLPAGWESEGRHLPLAPGEEAACVRLILASLLAAEERPLLAVSPLRPPAASAQNGQKSESRSTDQAV